MLKFNDGMEFDLSGEPRTVRRSDGWYVVGRGMLIPCSDREEGIEIIKSLKKGENHGS